MQYSKNADTEEKKDLLEAERKVGGATIALIYTVDFFFSS
jgi:hypothetical protein